MLNAKTVTAIFMIFLFLGFASANLEFRDPNPANFFTDIEMNGNNLTGLPNPSMDSEALNLGHANSMYLQRTGDSLEGNLDMVGNSILNLPTPENASNPATKQYVDDSLGEATGSQNLSQVLNNGNVANQSIDMNGEKITGAADPTDSQDVVTLSFFEDNQFQDLTTTRTGDTVNIGITNASGTTFTDQDTNASTECTDSDVLFGNGDCGGVSQNYIGDSQSHTAGGQLDMDNNSLTDLPTPSSSSDAATKSYVDNQISSSCPSGYVRVPGSTKHGTEDFCVMQYEAKDNGGDPVSQTSGSPWVNIDQFTARQECRDLGSDYHLITEAEWMTIADNMMRQEENWADSDSDGTGNIGSTAANGGGFYLGNVDPSGDHSHLGYNGANPESGTGRDTTARLQLSNGKYIWDFSGNVWEWTNGYVTTDGVPEPGSNGWTEYTEITKFQEMEDEKPLNPAWNASNGIGRIYLDQSPYSNNDKITNNIHAVRRGGSWSYGADAGPLSVILHNAPSLTSSHIGFRCVADI